ncbi:MAG: hypothetical protein Tsb009_19570 [Planctomycetaceae bacterium]
MRQVKLFKHVEAEIHELEKQVNEWMTEQQKKGGKIINVTGNIAPQTVGYSSGSANRFSPSDLLLIVEYEIDG